LELNGTQNAIPAYIQSGDFDLPTGGDGENMLMRISRFLPDFKNLQKGMQ
jgi:cell shape-determining protein MreC